MHGFYTVTKYEEKLLFWVGGRQVIKTCAACTLREIMLCFSFFLFVNWDYCKFLRVYHDIFLKLTFFLAVVDIEFLFFLRDKKIWKGKSKRSVSESTSTLTIELQFFVQTISTVFYQVLHNLNNNIWINYKMLNEYSSQNILDNVVIIFKFLVDFLKISFFFQS